MDALVLGQPRIKWAKRWIALALILLVGLALAMPAYADYFSGQANNGYLSLSSSGTSNSCLIIGTSTTADSYLSVGTTLEYWITAPNIQANSASIISMVSARLNAQILDFGGDNVSVRFGLDTASHTTFADYARISSWVASSTYNTYLDVTGLSTNTTYYYRAQIINSYSTVTSTNEISFTTVSTIGNALNLRGISSSTSIILTWQRASGSTHTIVRYRTDTYPSSPTDGTSAYSGTGYQCTVSGLTPGQVYYFSAWGYANPTSPTVSQLAISTTAVDVPSGGETTPANIVSIPTIAPGMTQTPSVGAFQLEPFTTIIKIFQGGLGMPENNIWQLLATLGVVLAGMATYIRIKNFFVAFGVVFVLTFFFVWMHLMQGWLIPIEVIVAGGVWAVERYMQ